MCARVGAWRDWQDWLTDDDVQENPAVRGHDGCARVVCRGLEREYGQGASVCRVRELKTVAGQERADGGEKRRVTVCDRTRHWRLAWAVSDLLGLCSLALSLH